MQELGLGLGLGLELGFEVSIAMEELDFMAWG